MLGLLCVLSSTGCRRQRIPQDELVLLIEQPPRNVDPRYATTSYDFKLTYLCFARLVSVDDDALKPKLELAEQVQVVSATPERGLVLEVTLRDAKFSDGHAVTSEDVRYTLDKLLDEKAGSPSMRSRFSENGLVRPIEILSPKQFRISFAKPTASYLTDLDFGILRSGTAEAGRARPIGAGPFVLSGDVGEITRFARNPHYFLGPPSVAALTVRVVRDTNSRLLSLVGGSADLTQNTVPPMLFDSVTRWKNRLELESAPSALLLYLGMNTEDGRLRNAKVRRAIALGIDRERIIRTKLRGKARLASSLLPPFHWAFSESSSRLQFDPEEAKRLLDAAGYPDPDGPGGKPRLTLQFKTSTDAMATAIARVIASQLAELDVAVELRPLEFHLFLSDVKKGNFHLYMLSSAEIAEPSLFRNFFHSSFIPTVQNHEAGLNRMRYRNPALDKLLEDGSRELDREKRKAIYKEIQEILAQELPMLPLWHPDNVLLARKGVVGFKIWPTAQLSGLSLVRKTH
ncbi:MAG TPA: ABC transporter substrate-binding protein [Pseudomonadota bacterium]|nr:ABC transporter substrate-binding protein [Pseudomonadota bacterium]